MGGGGGGGEGATFFQSSTYFTEGSTDLPREAIGPKASPVGYVPEWTKFLRKPIVTCDFLRGWGLDFPCPPSGSAHVDLPRL